jgi:hypothetical protein
MTHCDFIIEKAGTGNSQLSLWVVWLWSKGFSSVAAVYDRRSSMRDKKSSAATDWRYRKTWTLTI